MAQIARVFRSGAGFAVQLPKGAMASIGPIEVELAGGSLTLVDTAKSTKPWEGLRLAIARGLSEDYSVKD